MNRRFATLITSIIFIWTYISGYAEEWDPRMDFNNDGVMDAKDLIIFLNAWNTHKPTVGVTPTPTPRPTVYIWPTPIPTFIPSDAAPLNGIWIGSYQGSYTDIGVNNNGYIIISISQTGSALTIYTWNEKESLTGTITQNSFTASRVSSDRSSFRLTGTLSNNIITGNFDNPHSKDSFTVSRPGARKDLSGIWIEKLKVDYSAKGFTTNSTLLFQITQKDNQLVSLSLMDNYETTYGRLEGNVFLLENASGDGSGTVNGNSMTGAFSTNSDGNMEISSYTTSKYVGTTVQVAGQWTVSAKTIYPKPDPTIQQIPLKIAQNSNDVTAVMPNDKGGMDHFTGKIYGDSFILTGFNSDGNRIRIDASLSGAQLVGTFRSEGNNQWEWGTYTATR